MITTITGTIRNPQGIPLGNVKVRFSLIESGYAVGQVYPKGYSVETTTRTPGEFSIAVWNNTDSGARYEITFSEHGKVIDSFLAYVPIKPTVTIDEVRTYSGLTNVAPAVIYQDISTALTVLNQRLEEINTGNTGNGNNFESTLYYTKAEADNRFPLKTTVDGRYYLKTESDARYALKGEMQGQFSVTPSYYKGVTGQTSFIMPSTDPVVAVSINGYDMDASLYTVSNNVLTFPSVEAGDTVQILQQGQSAGIVRQEFTSDVVGTNVFPLSSPGNVYSVSVDGFFVEPSAYAVSPTTLVVYNLELGSKVIALRTKSF